MRIVFEQELTKLNNTVINMGADLEILIKQMIEVIIQDNEDIAPEIINNDIHFDLLELEIEQSCVKLIMTQQPLAKDLRKIISSFKIVTDMERIADQCRDICMYAIHLKDGEWSRDIAYKRNIEKMARRVENMLKNTMDSFINEDIEKLQAVRDYDDKIDDNFEKIWNELVQEMKSNISFTKKGAKYIMIIKYLERIADHITNIAEWFIYDLTGQYIKYID
ncbi:phosphate transport system regulatory protein PhoU [Candidatus Epulonipiscium fishelsonii]|uniref:Phosphate transport system regulatory protein PhoU n=1 Tax=Candidatus Epulonipiscium fishelsonii TaxID=77094 RepID=A0ACC8XA00_9FIRM|nr:phosphate transport system regulatory protein PhoU [Epulopiscium sp. SCG-B11WGA-EpuloA1]ONI40920.1 phosphate transport system regulatory protein PhoU [Epulopiscium sp. SCG-B05WGA-EpuloA1]